MTPDRRRPYIAGNWKMHKTVAETRDHIAKLLARLPLGSGVDLGLCVPFTAVAAAVELLDGADLKGLAPKMHPEPEGADTGGGSAPMLTQLPGDGGGLGHPQ